MTDKRYYYDDPITALYMVHHHKVKLEDADAPQAGTLSEEYIIDDIACGSEVRYYVRPGSIPHRINYDLVDNEFEPYLWVEEDGIDGETGDVVQRKGIAFQAPERE